ncbi:MAG: hypothetical protein U1E17_01470 [Geminicoccaceae bacterium]
MAGYAQSGVSAFAMELLPRDARPGHGRLEPGDLAGYKALVDAMAAYSRVMPMMMTAAGTVTPAKVFVVGAGVAGLQPIRGRAPHGYGDRDRRAAGLARGDRAWAARLSAASRGAAARAAMPARSRPRSRPSRRDRGRAPRQDIVVDGADPGRKALRDRHRLPWWPR